MYVCMLIVFLIHTYSTIVLFVLLFFFLLSCIDEKLLYTHYFKNCACFILIADWPCLSIFFFCFVWLVVYFIWILYIKEEVKRKKTSVLWAYICHFYFCVYLISAMEWRLFFVFFRWSSLLLPSSFFFLCLVWFLLFSW